MFRDYEEFFAALNAREARYLVVGAHAVGLYARPRATKDIDILFEPTKANAERVLAAITDFFGGADLGLRLADLTDPEGIIQLGVAPVRIDLLARIAGCPDFEATWQRRVTGRYGTEEVHYLGLDDLIRTKEAAAQADPADATPPAPENGKEGCTTRAPGPARRSATLIVYRSARKSKMRSSLPGRASWP